MSKLVLWGFGLLMFAALAAAELPAYDAAPSFPSFTNVVRATVYRFVVTDAQGASHDFLGYSPHDSLSPVWARLPPGELKVRCDACDHKGRVKGVAGECRFRKIEVKAEKARTDGAHE